MDSKTGEKEIIWRVHQISRFVVLFLGEPGVPDQEKGGYTLVWYLW